MFNFHPRNLLPILLSQHVLARPNGGLGGDRATAGNIAQYATSLTGGEGCSESEINNIRAGFAEMINLIREAGPYDPDSQPAHELFGNPERVNNYTELITDNFARVAQYGLLEGSNGRVNEDIHVRCDDPVLACRFGNRREGNHAAYNLGNEPHINFCEDYFRMDGLIGRVEKTANHQVERDRLMEYYNRATLWVRMVMHIHDIGHAVKERAVPAPPNATTEWLTVISEGPMNTSVLAGVLNERPDRDPNGPDIPPSLKYAYGVTRSKLLAILSTQMPYDAANNAENYALYAQARYVMNKKNFYPTAPIMEFSNEATVLTNENLQDGERTKFAFFDMPDTFPRPEDIRLEADPLPSAALTIHAPQWTLLSLAFTASSLLLAIMPLG